jgi:class 3 adenylate cyclase
MSKTPTIVRTRRDGTLVRVKSDGTEEVLSAEAPASVERTAEEVEAAAWRDPDARPMTEEELSKARRIPRVRTLRRALGLTQEEFSARYNIPVGTLRDWEQGRSTPDRPTRAYLDAIAQDPKVTQPPIVLSTTRLGAILAADVVGYSRLLGLDEVGTLARFRAIMAEVVEPAIVKGRGRIVKTLGDGVLAEFPSAVAALFYASEIQASMAVRNAPVAPDRRIEFRIGIHQGDVVEESDDLFGNNVVIAARLESQAEPGGIWVSERIQEDTTGKLEVEFEFVGEPNLKNLTRPVRAYRVHTSRTPQNMPTQTAGLIALGPSIVCEGELAAFTPQEWELRLRRFVIGDVNALIAFGEKFGESALGDRYLLVNALGDGRKLATAPSFIKANGGFTAKCAVLPKFPRVSASDLGSDLALSEKGDLVLKNGDLATVSGVEALPQRIRTSLSLLRGESPFHPDFGARLAEYYNNYKTSPWLEALLELEVIRQASIPYHDTIQNREYTPLQCIERVWGMELLAKAPKNRWLPVRFDFEVAGVGRRQFDVSVLIPKASELSEISARAAANRNLYFPAGNESSRQVRPIAATRSLPSPR